VIYRELRPDEFERIPGVALGGYRATPTHRIVAALDSDEIVGIWVVALVPHAEPIWIREDHRNSAVIIRRLWDGVKKIVRDMSCGGVVGIIPDSVPADKRIAEWLDAEKLPGNVYLWLDKKEN
jgi:hypothetical protein